MTKMLLRKLLLSTVIVMTVAAGVSAQNVTLHRNNISVQDAITLLNEASGYSIIVNANDIDYGAKVSINADNAPVEDVLRQIFKGQKIESRLSGNKIYVSKKAPQQTTASAPGAVRGFVRDINGEPLAGAGIVVKGTRKGVVADLDGRFSINVPAGTTLEVSYLGYVTQSISAKTGRDLVVVLQSDMNFLDELVVVGYGTQRKRNVVGAVENVGGEILENKSGSFMTRSLQGQIPGLNLSFRDGKPTTSASLQIRGTTQSIGAGGTALVIIDGVEGDLTTINPEDIESISVLKDASSAAVYGARGAFGVILLTTKKATEGKVSVDYNGSFQIYQETVRPTYVTDSKTWYENTMIAYDGAQHRTPPQLGSLFPWSQEWEDEFYRRINDPDNSYLPWDIGPDGRYRYYGRNNDWYNAYYKKATGGQQHVIRVSGGSKRVNFVASGRYYEQDGILRIGDQDFRQWNVRAKGTVHVTDWLTIENNTDFVSRRYHQPRSMPRSNVELNGFPIAEIYNYDGSFTANALYSGWIFIEQDRAYRENHKFDMKNSTVVKADIIKDVLTLRADYSYLFNNSQQSDVLIPVTYYQGPEIPVVYKTGEGLSVIENHTHYHSANANLTFSPKLGGGHDLTLLGGWNLEHKKARNTRMSRDSFLLDDMVNFSVMDGINYTLSDNGSYDWGFIGYYYRGSYNYKGKYLAEVSGRYDGSSKFPASQRWGFFPSASFGWRMSDEPFMKWSRNWLNNFKWRFSIGKAGNGNVSPYQYMELISISRTGVILDGNRQASAGAGNIIPDGITWETTSTIDLGVDINLFKNRLAIVGDIFEKNTTDMYVVGAEIPAAVGYSAPKGNNADMRTRGWELSLAWNDSFQLAGKSFNYNARFALWDSRSFITRYTSKTNYVPLIYANSYYEGMEIGEFWGYHVDGLFASDEEAQDWGLSAQSISFWSGENMSWQAGDIKFADIGGGKDENGNDIPDGVVNYGSRTLENHGDLYKIGNTSPRYHYGINLGASWNGFDASIFFQGIGKRDWYPAGSSGLFWGQYDYPWGYCLPWQNEDRWTPERQEADPDYYLKAYWPRLRGYLGISSRGTVRAVNDRYIQNARYLRLKNVSFGYTLPKNLTRKVGLEKVKFYVSGENLYFWSPLKKYAKNFDPEMLEAGDSVVGTTRGSQGDGYGYPMTKSYTFGINLTF